MIKRKLVKMSNIANFFRMMKGRWKFSWLILYIYRYIKGCTYYVTGDVVNAIEHLSNAVSLCGQPQYFLHELEQMLPPKTSNS